MSTWGATRCGGCGVQVRPAHLVDRSGFYRIGDSVGHVSCVPVACSNIACPGEIEDWEDLVCRGRRK